MKLTGRELRRQRKLCDVYRKACLKYLDLYGLNGFDFYFYVIPGMDAMATVEYNVGEVRSAKFRINALAKVEDVDALAKHEVLELLLAELATYAGELYSDSVVNAAVHKVLYSLVNADSKKEAAHDTNKHP